MRPTLHFTARSGWINDPHGVTFRDGRYEVFYQFVPDQTVWGANCHWGHAIGRDLLSLQEVEVAIAPDDGDGGIWTGSLVSDAEGAARIFYTSTSAPDYSIGRIRVATPGDAGWQTWEKGACVAEAPTDLDLRVFRDPFVRREGDTWRMFVGAGTRGGAALALSYVSDDLDTWEYAGVALERATTETEPVWTGTLWECPQIFELDGRAVMVSSVWDDDVLHYAAYAVGTYQSGVFRAESWGRLTFGDSYYAPSLFLDREGRHCLLFWMRGIGDHEAGWEGAHSVPHVLSLDGDRLVAEPHPDVAAHRGAAVDQVEGLAADITWSDAAGGILTISSGGVATVSIICEAGTLRLEGAGSEATAPFCGDVRVIVDGPVLEISSAAGLIGAVLSPTGESVTASATSGRVAVFPLA